MYSLGGSDGMIPALRGIIPEEKSDSLAAEITSAPSPVLIRGDSILDLVIVGELSALGASSTERSSPLNSVLLEETPSKEVEMADPHEEGEIIPCGTTEGTATFENPPPHLLLESSKRGELAETHHEVLDITPLSYDATLAKGPFRMMLSAPKEDDTSTALIVGGVSSTSSLASVSVALPPTLHSSGFLFFDTHAIFWETVQPAVSELMEKIISSERLPSSADFLHNTFLVSGVLVF